MAKDEKQDEPLNAVVITRVFKEDGGFDLVIGETGDVKPSERGDILAYALAIHRSRLGV